MARSQKPNSLTWIAILGLSAIAVVYLVPSDADPSVKKPPKLKVTSTDKKLRQDLNAHFEPLNADSANVFRPLFASSSRLGADALVKDNTKIPIGAAGEPDWEYRNCSQIDGRYVALLENSANQKTAVVAAGEKWKLATFVQISPEKILLKFGKDQTATISRYVEPKEADAEGNRLGPERKGMPGGVTPVQSITRG